MYLSVGAVFVLYFVLVVVVVVVFVVDWCATTYVLGNSSDR